MAAATRHRRQSLLLRQLLLALALLATLFMPMIAAHGVDDQTCHLHVQETTLTLGNHTYNRLMFRGQGITVRAAPRISYLFNT